MRPGWDSWTIVWRQVCRQRAETVPLSRPLSSFWFGLFLTCSVSCIYVQAISRLCIESNLCSCGVFGVYVSALPDGGIRLRLVLLKWKICNDLIYLFWCPHEHVHADNYTHFIIIIIIIYLPSNKYKQLHGHRCVWLDSKAHSALTAAPSDVQ